MTTLRLNLEAKLGVSIYQIILDLVEAANSTNIECAVRTNDLLIIAKPGSSADRITEAYHSVLTRGTHTAEVIRSSKIEPRL